MKDELIQCEFRVDGEVVESVSCSSVPAVGERVEVGGKFLDGERISPSEREKWRDRGSEYKTVLSGRVDDVRRHYCSAPGRDTLTAYIDVKEVSA